MKTFEELPKHWQTTIRELHAEVKQLRKGPQVAPGDLPPSWQLEFTRLRRDMANVRIQRNEARAELAALRAELEAGRGAE